jgi:uncharacterized integral membrane protein
MSSIVSVFRAILFLLATAFVLVFFLANRQVASFSLFPLPFTIELPLFIVPAVLAGVTLVLGYVFGAFPQLAARRALHKEVTELKQLQLALQEENAALRAQLIASSAVHSQGLMFHESNPSRVLQPASELFAQPSSSNH